MNINQMARNQQMMFKFISRNGDYASQLQSQFSSLNALNGTKNGNQLQAQNLLQEMGLGGLKGRTVREMAQYKIDVQENSKTTQKTDNGINLNNLSEQTTKITSRTLYTPISEKATKSMQNLALKDAKNSILTGANFDSKERATTIQEQLKEITSSKKGAAFNTMNKVWNDEMDRIAEYIKEKDSSWKTWGDEFDTSILDDYKPGVNVWV